MKINMPVTDNEVKLTDEHLIVSKTDLKGIITFTNPDFIEISGFTEKECIGKNHNMVRHPDMPAAAFEDLWNTVKAEKPWTGIVKNRCKNGDYYWVQANVTPLRENGRVVEYMSVRTKPTQQQIAEAEALYQKLNAGEKIKKSFGERFNLFNRLKLWQKLGVAGLVFMLVILASAVTLVLNANKAIEFTEKEVAGIQYLSAARQIMQNMPQHRGMTNAYLNGNTALEPRILKKRTQVDDNFEAMAKLDTELGAQLGISEKFKEIRVTWNSLKAQAFNLPAKECFSRHTVLLEQMIGLMAQVSENSNLKLDSGIDSSYIIDLLVNRIPVITEKMGQSRGLGSGVVSRGSFDQGQEARLTKLQVYSTLMSEGIGYSLDRLFSVNSDLKGRLSNEAMMARAGLEEFGGLVEKLLEGRFAELDSTAFFEKGTSAINNSFALYDAATPLLEELLHARIDESSNERMQLLIVVVIGIMLAIFAGAAVMRDILRAMNQTVDELNQLTEGNYKREIEIKRNDEIGDMLRGLKSTQIKLGFDVNDARQRANSMQRIKVALDNVSSNVMVGDNDGVIIYMNDSVIEMFRNAQESIRKELPDFNVDELVGTNIDSFHKKPEHQRAMLKALTTSHRARIGIGGRSFDLTANPVINENGQRLGTAVEWVDITEQLDAENQIENLIEQAVHGKLDERIDTAGYEGFMKNLGDGINRMMDAVVTPLKEVVRVLSGLAEGDLRKNMQGEFKGEFDVLSSSLNATMTNLMSIVSKINEAGDSITSASSEIAQGNTDLSQRTEEQASSLEETASSMEELTSTVRQNADNARQANQLAAGAREQAEKGGEVVGNAITAMSGINESSKKIADIIGVIDEIAFQTNLLALNAAVEAARAGEQGRGFAVVASEVRNLAQRSAEAAKEIKGLITDSVSKVEEGSQLVDDSGKTLEEIVTSVKKVSDIVAEIAAASSEQSAGIEQVNKAISQMDEVTQQNAALVEEAAAASESLDEQAQGLGRLMSYFKTDESAESYMSADLASESTVQTSATTPQKQQAPKPSSAPRKPKAAPAPSPAAGFDDSEWEEF
jgi:methyl-accepting chemotaxis protein